MLAGSLAISVSGFLPAAAQAQAPTPPAPADVPQQDDGTLLRGPVLIRRVTVKRSSLSRIRQVIIAGSLPTPCHQLRLRLPVRARADGTWMIEAWSLVEPQLVCEEVLQPFVVQVELKGDGDGLVLVNGVKQSRP